MRDTSSVDPAEAHQVEQIQPAGAVAAAFDAPAVTPASRGGLAALAGPQRAQVVSRLQRGYGNAAVATMLSPARDEALHAQRAPQREAPQPDAADGQPGSREAANEALAKMIAGDTEREDEVVPEAVAEEDQTPASEPAPEPPALPPVDVAHEFQLAAPDSATVTAGDEAALDAAPAPEPNAHAPPVEASEQASPLAVEDVDTVSDAGAADAAAFDDVLPEEPSDALPEAKAEEPAASAAAPAAAPQPQYQEENEPEDSFEEGLVAESATGSPVDESVWIGGGGAAAPAGEPDGPQEEGGLSLAAVAQEQRELIQSDSDASEGRVDEITAAGRERIAGEFGGVRQGVTALLASSSESVQGFIAERKADVLGVANGVLGAAQGAVTGALETVQAGADQARDTVTTFVEGVTASLQTRVQGIATQITGVMDGIPLPDLPGVAQLRSAASGIVNGAASAVTGGLGQVQGLIGSAVRTGAQLVGSLIANLGQLATTALTRVTGAIQSGVEAASTGLSRIADTVIGGIGTFVATAVLPVVDRTERRLVRALTKAQRHALRAIGRNRDEHLQALPPADGGEAGGGAATPEAAEALTAIGQETVEGNRAIVETYEQRTSSTIGSVLQTVTESAGRVVAHVAGIVAQAFAAVVSKVQEIVAGLQQIVAGVQEFVQSLLQEAATAIAGAVQFVRELVEQPANQLIEFASSAWNRLTGFVGGLAGRVLSGDFSIPSLSDLIGNVRPEDLRAGPPVKLPPPGPITLPGLGTLLLFIAVFGVMVVAAFPQLAVVVAALVALGLTEAAAFLVIGAVAILVLILVLILLWILFKLLTSKPKKPKDPKPTIEPETDLNAPDGSPKTRTDVGVGERVVFKGSAAGQWTASGGAPGTGTGTKFAWRAPVRASTGIDISLTVGSETASVTVNVHEPNAMAAIKDSEDTIPAGTQGAGMTLNFKFSPVNVSFGNAGIREVAGPASNITGYYLLHGMPHAHNPGAPNFHAIAEDNTLAGGVRDRAAQRGYPSPWSDGTFHWEIPNKFKVMTEGGDGKEFTQTIQAFVIDATGKTTITKAGEKVERTP